MTAPVSILPQIPGAFLPPAMPQGVSDDEQRLITGLQQKLTLRATYVRLNYLYYDGEQAVQNLGISIPDILAGIRQVVDWPRIVVDRLVERAGEIDGFRLPNATEVDTELADHWRVNDLDSEFPLVQQDSLVGGCGYMIVGSPDMPGDSPIVTTESPLNLALVWDPRRRMVTAAYQSYEAEGVFKAALYLPDQTISMSRDETSQWVVDYRDDHRFGEVPVVRFPNRPRTSDREGRSQITDAIKNTTDSACRSLLAMEIAREVYSVPHMWILGAKESDFQDAQGNRKTSLQLAMTAVNALERDSFGELPQLHQATAFDPSVFTKILDNGAQRMAGYTGFPPGWFGQTTTANPASADAIRVGMDGADRASGRVQLQATAGVRKVGQLIWRFANSGRELTDEMKRLSVDWIDSRTPTPAATTDSVSKQISAGVVAPWSDVALAELGYSPVQRARIAQDWKGSEALQLEALLTSSLAARQARAANSIASDLEKADEGGAVPPQAPPEQLPSGPQSR